MRDTLSKSVEQNWLKFKAAISETVSKHVPHKTVQSRNHLLCINKQIKKDMKIRKCLYNKAKRTNSNTYWITYRQMKNLVNNKLKVAHNNYFSRIFDASFSGNRCQFWKYIRAKCKDNNDIYTLTVNGQCASDTKSKATVLNNYFKSVFTKENLTHILPMVNSGSSLP